MKLTTLKRAAVLGIVALTISAFSTSKKDGWQSKFVTFNADGSLTYHPDKDGAVLPDFSLVGYHQNDVAIPDVPVVKTIEAPKSGDAGQVIQDAIDEVSKREPDASGYRGTLLLKKGTYSVSGILSITVSGVVLRGEGDDKNGTRIIAAGNTQRTLLNVHGSGAIREVGGSRVKITDGWVPVGAKSFNVESTAGFKVGDPIILFRPSPQNWIHDLKMDQIVEREGTKQWKPGEYDLHYERVITKIEGNKVFIDNPVVMQLEAQYGGGAIYKYTFNTRIKECGVEHIYFESEFTSATDENHGWIAVEFKNTANAWVRNVTSKYFGYACVSLEGGTRNITVTESKCLDAKSQITGGRRYSFNNTGQMNLFMNCHTEDGRHDYVTGARVCGPNVFYNSTAKNEHADIGPHHRWSSGTLYDNIVTDGEINVQDRGYMGSGHGWSGVTQILWNCTAKKAAVQKPWVSGTNYCIGFHGSEAEGAFKGRWEGEWEGTNKGGLQPASLYMAQLNARHAGK